MEGAKGDSNRQLRTGERIAGTSYRVTSLVGLGGMGSVYEVEHEVLGRRFVFKLLHDRLLAREDLVARMQNEWRALAGLMHPNIVQVTDAGITREGLPFYVMEKLEGATVAQLIRANKRLSVADAGSIILDVLSGLDAAHRAHVVHRDIKPQNLFRTREGVTKLLDFGIAKLQEKSKHVVTAAGVALGTPRYMAPEQAEGKPVDGRADIYACGLVLYEMLLGKGPFAHIKEPSEVVLAHIHEEPLRLDAVDPTVPPMLSDLVHRWLAKSPESRPLSAELARRELSAVLAGLFSESIVSASEPTGFGAYDAETLRPEGTVRSDTSSNARRSDTHTTEVSTSSAMAQKLVAPGDTETVVPRVRSASPRALTVGDGNRDRDITLELFQGQVRSSYPEPLPDAAEPTMQFLERSAAEPYTPAPPSSEPLDAPLSQGQAAPSSTRLSAGSTSGRGRRDSASASSRRGTRKLSSRDRRLVFVTFALSFAVTAALAAVFSRPTFPLVTSILSSRTQPAAATERLATPSAENSSASVARPVAAAEKKTTDLEAPAAPSAGSSPTEVGESAPTESPSKAAVERPPAPKAASPATVTVSPARVTGTPTPTSRVQSRANTNKSPKVRPAEPKRSTPRGDAAGTSGLGVSSGL